MTDVSEAEVEAAVGGALEDCGGWAIEPDEHRERFIKMIRAALTAAAQVRVGAGSQVIALRAEKEKVLADKKEHGWTPKDTAWHRAFGRLSGLNYAIDLLVDAPSAEPDYGPSVLGIPKGEE